MKTQSCSVAEARQRLDRGDCAVLDVREYPEYTEAHLEGSRLVPLGDLRQRPELGGNGTVLLLCRSGRRAKEAAEILALRGGAQPVVIEGGIEAWKQAGYPVRRERGPIALERQVRIAAGTLVLAGLLIPGALPLSYLVGAGLIFAGVTNSCAMGLLLAKLPWNRARPRREIAEAGCSTCATS
jgi:rhodanese-related sulfurtransferase